MHLQRLITAAVALPLLILLILKGSSLLFSALIAVVAAFGMREYFRIVQGGEADGIPVILQGLGYLACPVVVFSANHASPHLLVAAVALNVLLAGILALYRYGEDPKVLDALPRQIQGVVYLPLLLSYLVLLRNGENGNIWVFLLLVLVFAGDTGAFYVGRRFGKHKLCPSVSPGKTVEGFFGGLSATFLLGIVFTKIFLPELSFIKAMALFLTVGIAGPLGDLYESAMKRRGMIKDSGSILPGHGGILDRIDALLFAAPLCYLFKIFIA